MRPLAMHARPIGKTIQRTMTVSSTDNVGLLASRSARIAFQETSRASSRDRPTRRAQEVGRATIAFVVAGR